MNAPAAPLISRLRAEIADLRQQLAVATEEARVQKQEAERYLELSELYSEKLAAAIRQNAAGQVLEGAAHTDHPMRHYDRTCPACNPDAPTLAELSAKAGDSLIANARFMDELLNAYRAGRLREIGEGEVVVPKEPTEAMVDAAVHCLDGKDLSVFTNRSRSRYKMRTRYKAMLAAKEGK